MATVVVTEPQLKVTKQKIIDRHFPSWTGNRRNWRNYEKEPRLYFWFKGESILDHLFNRCFEPSKAIRKILDKVLSNLNIKGVTKIRWSQYAGCSCPCSPGFILYGATYLTEDGSSKNHFDIHIEIEFKNSEDLLSYKISSQPKGV